MLLVKEILGDHLVEEKEYSQAIIMFQSSGNITKAIKVAEVNLFFLILR